MPRKAKQLTPALIAKLRPPASGIRRVAVGGVDGLQIQISDTGALQAAVDAVIAENPDAVADIRAGEHKAIGFLTGQIMKKTRGQANAGLVQQLIRERLEVE